MLAFLFGSSMFVIALSALALMAAIKRHKKYKRFTAWGTFAFALIAGSAISLTFLGEWAGGLLAGLAGLLGAPAAAVGVIALFFLVGAAADLADGKPDGFARTSALVLPTLLTATGGALGLYGTQATTTVSQAGAALLGNLIGI
ncbi:hypothetical protein CLV63_14117 [Murinocardiopsis flavida]|uniref:Uncharacterized protein n=1 Tax=Murinocardiopsis flavida TaxID=645275 RepID=A0A2P8CDJ8_9ACTN|nr:hypothetical protein [Murinocardiopsis flavida]PSK83051.1 hypothetical protein CLV63_14117 [Murinocardiopsis flavida]